MPATRSRPSTEQAEVVSEEVKKDVEASPVKEKVAETKTEEAKPAAEEKADSAEEAKEEAEKTPEEAPKANGGMSPTLRPPRRLRSTNLRTRSAGTPEKKAKVEEKKEEEAAKEAAPTEEAAA
ncbi:hypothetical protein MTO96_000754 [Rhipicephalus appendiculatus]